MSGIYVSTGAFKAGSLAAMAEACEAMGAGIELSSGVPWHDSLEREIEDLLARRKGNILVHNYFPPPEKPFVLNLASTNRQTLARGIEHVRAAIDLSARCGAPFYSVHSGFAMELPPEALGKPEAQALMTKVPYAKACSIFLESVSELSSYAKSRGLRLLIENNVITRQQVDNESPLLMTEPWELAKFFDCLGDPNIGLLLDVGHAKVAANALGFDPAAFFADLSPWIVALHLSDNDGQRDNNQPFSKDAWFGKYDMGDMPVVIESYKIPPDSILSMVNIVKHWRGEQPA